MKKAFGVVELLFIIIIVIILYFTCFHSSNGRVNPFDEGTNVKNQQKIIDEKLQQIEKTQDYKRQIEKNLKEGY